MILTSVSLNVVFEQRDRQFTQVAPSLEAQFTLQCLVCGHTHQLATPTVYRLRHDEKPHNYVHPISTVVRQTRSCDNCGILSTLPKFDFERLEKQLKQHITQDFIDRHCQDQAPFLAQRLLDCLKLM